MWPDQVSNPGSLTYESGALPTGLCGSAKILLSSIHTVWIYEKLRLIRWAPGILIKRPLQISLMVSKWK